MKKTHRNNRIADDLNEKEKEIFICDSYLLQCYILLFFPFIHSVFFWFANDKFQLIAQKSVIIFHALKNFNDF